MDCSPNFKVGDVVQVNQPFVSINDSAGPGKLQIGERGSVMQADDEGDVQVHFFDHVRAMQWVSRSELGSLSLLPMPPNVPKRPSASSKKSPVLKLAGTFGKAQVQKQKACAKV